MNRICGALGSLIVLGVAAGTPTRGADKPILVLDVGGHTAAVHKVLLSRDGKELLSVSDDKTIRVWDVSSGEPLRTLRPPIGTGNEGRLFAGALDPDGTTLAVGGFPVGAGRDGHPIYLLSFATGRIERVLTGHERVIKGLAFSADGRRLISGSGDQTARIWNVSTGQTEHVLRGHTNDIYGVTFSPDGRRCATASHDKTAAVWDVATGQRLATLSGHTAEVRCLAWSRDGRSLATGSYDHTIRLWRAGDVKPPSNAIGNGNAGGMTKNSGDSRPPLASYKTFDKLGDPHILSVTFTADGHRLLYTGVNYAIGAAVAAMLDIATGRELARFDQHTNTVRTGTLSTNGALSATAGGDDMEIFLWKTADGARVHKLVGRGRVPWAAAWSANDVAATRINPFEARIAWGNAHDAAKDEANKYWPLERTFDLSTLEFGPAPNDSFVRARLERGSLALVAGKPNQVGCVDSVLVRQGDRTLATLEMSEPYEEVRSFTLLPNDRLAVGTEYSLRLYDSRSGKQLREFQGHTGAIWAVSPSPDGRYLLSASGDMTLRVWDPDRDEPLLSCFFVREDWIVWTPEGYYTASPGGEKLMGWHVNNGREQMASFYHASQFRSTLHRPDVIKLLLQTGSVERALEIADTARGRMTGKTEVAEILPPTVRITSPGALEKNLSRAELDIRAVATSRGSHPVTALKLLIDGRPHEGKGGVKAIASPKVGDATADWTVTLSPGKHRLQVLADSSVSQGASDEVEVVYVGGGSSADVELPALYLFAVGISRYPGDLKLDYAAKDAEAVVAAFQSKSKPLFRKIEVKTLTDQQATRGEILKGLNWLRKEVTQRDYAVFSFSGHGQKDADGGLYFLPVDVDTDNLSATAILADQITLPLKAVPGKIILLLDACHSGAVDGGRRKEAGSLTDDLVRDLVTDESGVVVMCSSTGREFSLENNQHRQGNFTLSLVEGLSGKADYNKDGSVYLNELDTYVTDRVKELSRGQQHPVTAKPTTIRSFPLSKP